MKTEHLLQKLPNLCSFFDDLLKKREGQETRIEAFLIEDDYKTAKEALNTIRANYKLTDPKEMNNIKKSVNTFIKEYLEDENISYYKISKTIFMI